MKKKFYDDPKKKIINPYVDEFRHYKNNDSVFSEVPKEYKKALKKLATSLGMLRTVKGKRDANLSELLRDIILFALTHVDQLISWRVQHYRLLAEQKEQE